MERFLGLEFTDHQKYILLSSWVPANVVWLNDIGHVKSIELLEVHKAS